MATDDIGGEEGDVEDVEDEGSATERTKAELKRTRDRLGEGAGRAVKEFDDGIVDLLAWLLDTETRARIYVYLREHPERTSDEIAEGTGLYPSTVREALAELHDEETVSRSKREADGAGNNPYEYEAIAPSELVRGVVGDVQAELNAVFTLDSRLGGDTPDDDAEDPVQISVAAPAADDDTAHEPADPQSTDADHA
jgi:predicted transcriptional regulator